MNPRGPTFAAELLKLLAGERLSVRGVCDALDCSEAAAINWLHEWEAMGVLVTSEGPKSRTRYAPTVYTLARHFGGLLDGAVSKPGGVADGLEPQPPAQQSAEPVAPVDEDRWSRVAFEAWWLRDGQFLRAGGGDYEKTFAWHAWNKALAIPCECAAPPVRRPLTAPQIAKLLAGAGLKAEDYKDDGNIEDLVRAIERGIGGKDGFPTVPAT